MENIYNNNDNLSEGFHEKKWTSFLVPFLEHIMYSFTHNQGKLISG